MKEAYVEMKENLDATLFFQQEFRSMRDVFMIG